MATQHHHHHRLVLQETKSGDAPMPANRTRTRGSYTNEANFDSDMVIVLAALLCALTCVLCLNSIVRCALRCGRRFATEPPGEMTVAAERLVSTGLKKSAIRRIPVVVYGSGSNITVTDCPICLGEFAGGEKVRVLPKCNHGFHMKCIDTWLLTHLSCPTCRQYLPENLPASDPPDVEAAGLRLPENVFQ